MRKLLFAFVFLVASQFAQATDVTVEIGRVERFPDEPRAKRPQSVQLNGHTSVNVILTPSPLPAGETINFSVSGNSSGVNGVAFCSSVLSASGTIDVLGIETTSLNNGGNLRISASGNNGASVSKVVLPTDGFSVCAHPTVMHMAFNSPAAGPVVWGGAYDWNVDSDTGNPLDMIGVEVCPILYTEKNGKSGFFEKFKFETTGPYLAINIGSVDTHSILGFAAALQGKMDKAADNKNGVGIGTANNLQYWRFSCACCGIAQDERKGPILKESGFRIVFTGHRDANPTPPPDYNYFIGLIKQPKAITGSINAGSVFDTTHEVEIK
jgi:hypothetical protein